MLSRSDFSQIDILIDEPLKDSTPEDIRNLLQYDQTEKTLAAAMATVANQTGWIGHSLDDPDNDEATNKAVELAFDAWWALEKELYIKISNILIQETPNVYIPESTGWHYIIQPFMTRNGYRDGGGWWIKEAVIISEAHFDQYVLLTLDQDVPNRKHNTYFIDDIAYKPEHLHIRPLTGHTVRNVIAIKSPDSFLGKIVRFELI